MCARRRLGNNSRRVVFVLRCRVDTFRGRQDIIARVEAYVKGTCNEPMVLYGVSGSGKTSVIAKAASLVNTWLPQSMPATVVRFLGSFKRVLVQLSKQKVL